MLFVIDKFAGAQNIIDELTIVNSSNSQKTKVIKAKKIKKAKKVKTAA